MKRGPISYDPLVNRLTPVAAGELRPWRLVPARAAGERRLVRLVYVADIDRLANTAGFAGAGTARPDVQRSYYFVDAGLIAANVYSSPPLLGLAAWFHNCDKPALAAKLNLRADQRPLFAQTVGYPADKPRERR